jgi:hypothetical protein
MLTTAESMVAPETVVAAETVGSSVAAVTCLGVHGKGYDSHENAGDEKLPHLFSPRATPQSVAMT